MRKKLYILILIALIFSSTIFTQKETYKLDKFEYKITIESRILPLFVVDKKGNPVFDLKKSDLTLFVNGKKTDISYLMNHKLSFISKDKEEVIKTVYKKKTKQLERVVFIVFDTIFNSRYGMKRMKIIAIEIIETGSDHDYFMIIGIDEKRGLFPIYGPSKKGRKLLKKIKKSHFFSSGEKLRANRKDIEYPGNLVVYDKAERIIEAYKNKERDILAFSFLNILGRLKKVIEKVIKPKIVYIFSEGIINKSIYEYELREGEDISKKWDLKKVKGSIIGKLIHTIDSLNKSGASMFLINPGRINSEFGTEGGKTSLKMIARETGGEYFEGTKVKTIVENVKKRADAYYELVFHVESKKKKRKIADKVRIVSRNRNIKIYTPKNSVATKKYGDLDIFEKKLRIIGLIEDSKWNYIDGNVQNRSYKRKIKSDRLSLNVKIPKELSKMYCDIYKVKLKKNSRNPEIIKTSKNSDERENIIFDNVSDESLFFVIISKHSDKILVGRVE